MKAKGKGQEAKGKSENRAPHGSNLDLPFAAKAPRNNGREPLRHLLLPFDFCLLPFDFLFFGAACV